MYRELLCRRRGRGRERGERRKGGKRLETPTHSPLPFRWCRGRGGGGGSQLQRPHVGSRTPRWSEGRDSEGISLTTYWRSWRPPAQVPGLISPFLEVLGALPRGLPLVQDVGAQGPSSGERQAESRAIRASLAESFLHQRGWTYNSGPQWDQDPEWVIWPEFFRTHARTQPLLTSKEVPSCCLL